jgi:prophage DNA circulation protein
LSTIRDLPSGWRDQLMPADFDGYPFHVEQSAIQNGRRIVLHSFPKKDLPYAEDMGRSEWQFTVRAYFIQYPMDLDLNSVSKSSRQSSLYLRDYRIARDRLSERLSQGGPGLLQLPTATQALPPMYVVCTRHVISEDREHGGFCTMEISFTEVGAPPFQSAPDAKVQLKRQTDVMRFETLRRMSGADARVKALRANV